MSEHLFSPKTIFEPFKIKTVEPIPVLTMAERQGALRDAHFNLFSLPAESVTFDFLTDSGTSAMSSRQWAGIVDADESYAGSKSYFHFVETIQEITGIQHVIPTHQGRSAEALLCKAVLSPGQHVVGNTQFDTTRANIESSGGHSIDLPCAESADSQNEFPFKGNVDLRRLELHLREYSSKIPFFLMTVTNNSIGGQPVSIENIRATKKLLNHYNIPLFFDAARFAENAYFIKARESEFSASKITDIVREMFSYADGILMSAKKDAFANIGGFLAVNDAALASQVRQLMVITEGFPTYGGLSGRDLEAIAIGLREILDENYLSYRIRSVEYFGQGLESAGFKIVKPLGGHAVYIDAKKTAPHIPVSQYPAQALSVALYEHIGVRSVEIGSVMFGRYNEETRQEEFADKELVRLALPRRVYTQSHIDYVIEMAEHVFPKLSELSGFRIEKQSKYLRHFTAQFSPLKGDPR